MTATGSSRRRSAGAWLLAIAAGGCSTDAAAQPPSPAPDAVGVCDGAPEWPPFTYFRRVDGRATQELTGFSVDVISAILSKARLPFHVKLLPWRRCLTEVANGGRYQIALEATRSPERASTYLISRPFYKTSGHYFYSRQHFPTGPAIHTLADLKRYRICGLLGYNYSMYGLDNQAVDQALGDHETLIRRLQAGRCDLFVEQIEVMNGYRILGRDLLADPDLGHQAVPGLPNSQFHMLVSRQAPRGAELLRVLDAGIAELAASHQLDKLWAKHVR